MGAVASAQCFDLVERPSTHSLASLVGDYVQFGKKRIATVPLQVEAPRQDEIADSVLCPGQYGHDTERRIIQQSAQGRLAFLLGPWDRLTPIEVLHHAKNGGYVVR